MTTVNATVQLLATAAKTLNAAREHATASNDTEMRVLINAAYDQMAALKEAVVRVTDENAELRGLIAQLERPEEVKPTPKIRQVGAVNYYFVGDEGPYCQPCYDGKGKLVALSPATETFGGGVRRDCPLCHQSFDEKKIVKRSQVGGSGGPQDWML